MRAAMPPACGAHARNQSRLALMDSCGPAIG